MNNTCVLSIDDRIYCKEVILKTAYLFVDDYYMFISYKSNHIITVSIQNKKDLPLSDIDKRFSNELIAQMVHYDLSNTNRNIKDLILGRALYSTYFDADEENIVNEKDEVSLKYSLDDIAVDWFVSK